MSFEIKIYNPKNLSSRGYINIKINGKWIKEYNGNKINSPIKPNLASTYRKRTSLLNQLEYDFRKAIDSGFYPLEEKEINLTTEYVLKKALEKKESLNLNHNYIRNLRYIYESFIDFLSDKERKSVVNLIKRQRIQEFLLQFNSSGTYYMNKRRDLGVLFSQVAKDFEITVPSVKSTDKLKSKPNLHKIYSDDQLNPVLAFLKEHHPNLHLCCLISYGCLLRPHQEVRMLTKAHFHNNFTEIHLSAKENKSGRHRIVYVPDYVQAIIIPLVESWVFRSVDASDFGQTVPLKRSYNYIKKL
ncbi:hypothetical protein [Sphingobacterium paucimobilis]|uniref:Tyr recombinase domain-containing protein n=1 Tax=Sphingobacterium paucimobilis HER1398 TaxID=1346330 RepID=U2HRV3_9SPHI|nr:hypothetical protein [Sphingobacterium paucimobilis]ERJ58010.1 hypothetical protein M472_04460 [Sphingobacterium paucimobilis HER1398]